MAIIVQEGSAVLRNTALPITEAEFGTPELTSLVADMLKTLDAEKDGVALAAPQIGISKRIFVVRYDRLTQTIGEKSEKEPEYGIYINPIFVNSSRRRDVMEEGCLSIRGTYGRTLRHERATVRARTPEGGTFERGGGGILSQVFQHEIDHLDGILFVDHALEMYDVSAAVPGAEVDERENTTP